MGAIHQVMLSIPAAAGGSSLPATDDFNRANSTTGAGNCSDGVHSWVDLIGTSGINSNRFYFPTVTGGLGLAYIDIGTVVATHQATAVNALSVVFNSSIAFRVIDSDNFWMAYIFWNGDDIQLYKREGGTFSQQDTASITIADGDVVKVTDDGTNIEVFHNGVSKITRATTLFNSATKCGLYAENVNSRWDDYSVV